MVRNSQFQLPNTNTGKYNKKTIKEYWAAPPLAPKLNGMMLLKFGIGIISDILGRNMLAPQVPGIPAEIETRKKLDLKMLKEIAHYLKRTLKKNKS